MKKLRFIVSLGCVSALFLLSCTKDKGRLTVVETPTIPVVTEEFKCEDTAFNWTRLPDEPPFGYVFQRSYGKDSPFRVLFDLQDKNIIYFTTIESSAANKKLWKLNRTTNIKTLLDEQVLNNIDINKSGWLLYEKIDKNIYKIKTNGDSLKRLTTAGCYILPRWSYDGQSFFVFKDAAPSIGIHRLFKDGKPLDTLKTIINSSQICSDKNFIYYQDYKNGEYIISCKDLKTNEEKTIVSKANKLGAEIGFFFTDFDNLNLFWYSNSGLYKTNLSNLHTSKIINGGVGSLNRVSVYSQSPFNKRFIAIQYNTDTLNSFTLKTWNNLIEYTESGDCRRKVTIPD